MKLINNLKNYTAKVIKTKLIKSALKERHIGGAPDIRSDTTLFAAYKSGKAWIDGERVHFNKKDKDFIISMTGRDRAYMFGEVVRMLSDLDWAHCAVNFLSGFRAKPCDVVDRTYAKLRANLAEETVEG